MGSISHHIMPLIINSLGGGHTHTQTHKHTYTAYAHTDTAYAHTDTAYAHTDILTICIGSILRNQVQASYGRCSPGLKIKNLANF